jgi:hypothetical protein
MDELVSYVDQGGPISFFPRAKNSFPTGPWVLQVSNLKKMVA